MLAAGRSALLALLRASACVACAHVHLLMPCVHTPPAACSEEESKDTHGHITSLAVARTHRKLGLATRLMTAARARGGARCLGPRAQGGAWRFGGP